MKLRTALLAGASVLAMTTAASADPFTIGTFVLGNILPGLIGSVSPVLVGQIVTTVAAVAASLGASLLARQAPTADPGDYKNTFDVDESSEVNAIGRVRLGGLKVFGNTKEYNRYRWIWHCKGPMINIEEYWLGGREVTLNYTTGAVESPPFGTDGGSYVYVRSQAGTGSETAWSELTTDFPDLITSNHRGRGIFQSLVWYISPGLYTEEFGRMFQGGEPDLALTARVNVAYDPRDVAQDVDDESTWEWTQNGILCACRILLSWPNVTTSMIDWDFIGTEATKADTSVATKTGTEPRARLSGVWLSETPRGEVMQQVLDSIGAEIVTTDAGLIRIRFIEDSPTSEGTIPATQQTELTWKSGPDGVERPNLCVVKYYSPELNYIVGEIDMTGIEWARVQDEIDRYGEKPMTIELPFCPSASQAQRIARQKFAVARADSGTIRTNMSGLLYRKMMYVSIEDSDAGETMLTRIAPPRVDDESGEVDIPYTVWPTLTTWNPATDEADAPEEVPPIQYQSALDTPAAPVIAALVRYPGGTYEVRIKFNGVTGATVAEAIYRTYSGGLVNGSYSMTEYFGTTAYFAYDDASLVGVDTDFRVRFYNADGESSNLSPALTVANMQFNNTACQAPSVTFSQDLTDITLDVVVADIQAVYVVVEIRKFTGSWGSWSTVDNFDVQPERPPYSSEFTVTDGPGNYEVRAAARTTNGTIGTYWTQAFTIDP